MANKKLFASMVGALLPKTGARNEAGGTAYALSPEAALAQYAATGCLNSTYYADAGEQLATVLDLAGRVDADFVARTAVFARKRGFMKDMPALLAAVLAKRDVALLAKVFDRVVDNGKMLRNFVQVLRSGVAGRKSLGSAPKRLVRRWLDSRSNEALFRASVGNAPSLADVVKMVHPAPATLERDALYGYLLGKPHEASLLPELVRQYEAFRRGETGEVPAVPFEFLTSLDLDGAAWKAIARNASWQMARMNLNTFARHGVFEDAGVVVRLAALLRDPAEVARARAFPYQLLVAYRMAGEEVPAALREALQDALEAAVANVPALEGKVYVCLDVSGSMHSPVTGHRKGSTTAVSCVDVAALVAAAVLRKNPSAEVIPFADDVVKATLNPRDSVLTNAVKLAGLPSGGTNISAPLAALNKKGAPGDLVLYVSDNQSWMDTVGGLRGNGPTETLRQWAAFRKRNPGARLACLDLQPYGTVQAPDREDILNVGGFSDAVFDVLATFARGELEGEHWVAEIRKVEI